MAHLLPSVDLTEKTSGRDIYSVTRLNSEVRSVLNGSFPLLWVEGEISNLVQPRSGHIYFSLKDANAQVRCAMFRMRSQALRFQPANGERVLLRAKINLYEPRGDYQLTVENMQPAGEGALRRAFDELKARLAEEGLFDAAKKKPLPHWPKRIGVITSPSGAAVRDVISVLGRRFAPLEVVIYPTLVQGEAAASQIADTIRLADERRECDVLIVTRGGGSLEDLVAFNDEGVARAIFAAVTPVVSAVGHEIDFSIADFVADYRAATPSAAAEAVSPDGDALRSRLEVLHRRLFGAAAKRIEYLRFALGHIRVRMEQQHPGQRLRQQAQRLDELELRLQNTQLRRLQILRQRVETLALRLWASTPAHRIGEVRQRQDDLAGRLGRAMIHQLERRRIHLQGVARELSGVSPLATLGRGYSITYRESDRTVVGDVAGVITGDRLVTRLRQGEIVSVVE